MIDNVIIFGSNKSYNEPVNEDDDDNDEDKYGNCE